MHPDLLALKCLVRLARGRAFVDLDALALRIGGSFDQARAALTRLAYAGLAERTPRGLRPTLAGLAIAVAAAELAAERRAPRARAVARPRVPRRYAA
jgi:hypothetical protein